MQYENLWHMFTSTAATHLDDLALVVGQKKLTYRQLLQEVYFYIDYLQKQNVQRGDVVGILLPRDASLVVAILGIIGSGAAYVPLNSRYPQSRQEAILTDSNCKFLVTESSTISTTTKLLVPPQGGTLVIQPNNLKIDSTDLAYIIYTSGSTGMPKGVMISHGNAYALIKWVQQTYTREQLAFTLVATSICFDLFVFEMFAPLTTGGCMVLVNHALSLIDDTPDEPITLINTVPSAIEALVTAKAIPDSVATINLAGEALLQALVNNIYSQTKVKKIYNLYGPTEATTYSTFYLAEKSNDRLMVPIGQAIAGTKVYLLDHNQHPVPKLGRGEIYIGGVGVAQGYCNREQENQKRFINLTVNNKEIKLYRTGDLARFNDMQELEYLGRQDQQIKLRGFRVEPNEIAHALKQHPHVAQAYIMTHPEVGGGQQLLAYVVSEKTLDLDQKELSIWLEKYVPDYMIPSYYIQLPHLPLNVNGKIERNQLPLPIHNEIPLFEVSEEIASSLMQIWQSLLGIKDVKNNDNFFYVGGHSLLAANLQSKIQEVFKVEFKLEEIFSYPTLSQQAQLISERELKCAPVKFEKLPRPKKIPLSFEQQRLWYLQYAQKDIPISNIPITITIQGELDISALTKAFTAIIRRHEILRTTYEAANCSIEQIVQDKFDFVVDEVLCNLEELPSIMLAKANKKFDLCTDLMINATFFKVSDGQRVLMVTQHHIASDAWSLNILMRELSSYYQAYHRKESLPELPVPLQYADYSCWQRNYLNDVVLQDNINFWKQKLEHAPETIKLPYDLARTGQESYRGQFYQWQLPTELVAQLQAVANRNQATLFMVLLTAFNILLYRYTQQNDFCVGILSANRSFSELEHTLGFFVNTLVARNLVDSNVSARTLLRQVRETVLECLAHQQLPFDKLVETLRPNHDSVRHPFFQVLFSLQNSLIGELELDDLTVDVNEYDRNIAKFDLSLSLVEKPQGLFGTFEFNSDLFYPETIVRLSTHYTQILRSLISDLDTSVGDIELFTAAEKHRWLVELNGSANCYNDTINLGVAFHESANKNLSKMAVISGNDSLTYGELDEKSSQLANLLKEYGIGVGSNVGLLLPRCPETIISILGVIKTGACYIPLDPCAPIDRLDYILKDADINLVLSMQDYTNNLPSILDLDLLLLETLAPRIIEQKSHLPEADISATSNCYIIYTSGSTGKPKGVIASHEGVFRLVKNCNYVHLDEHQVLLQVSQLVFDGSTFDIWGSLLNGATLVMMPDGLPNLNTLAALVQQHQVTALFVTTHLFNSLVDYKLPFLSPLKQLLFGGDVASVYHVKKFQQAHPDCAISNIYGPTETTTFALSYLIPQTIDTHHPLPLGVPINDTSVVILSEHMQLTPVNVPGEIYLGGPRLANGYLNQTELTQEKFIKNPVLELPTNLLYRTGDIGAYRADGQIVFLGRRDDQIKLRGYRIELPEIEQVLRGVEQINDAVVIVQKPEEILVAYIIYVPGQTLNVQLVQDAVARRLPKYMVPDAIEVLSEYPLTNNGKIDKSRLPAHKANRRKTTASLKIDNEIASIIHEVWMEILEDSEVTYEDNFFEIGGNSLKIIHILDRLQTHFCDNAAILKKLDITVLFQYPNIAKLTNFLSGDSETVLKTETTLRRIERRANQEESVEL
jgi:amino acid adenylation domain-containing protein